MNTSDLIADTLTVIRNGNMRRHEYVDAVYSKINEHIIQILKDEEYISNFRILEDKPAKRIRIYLKYHNKNRPAITNLKRISKPSLRVYVKKDEIPYVIRGRGMAIISTSKGMVTDKKARELKLGGEVICYIW